MTDFWITPNKTAAQWVQFRSTRADGSTVEFGTAAFNDFLMPRLDVRYLKPIRVLRENGSKRGEGFAIVTLQCALIEFLATLRTGKRYVQGGQETDLVYASSKKQYLEFLTSVSPFQEWMDQDAAMDFYKSVRCGLLHEARTNGGWKIRLAGRQAIDPKSKVVFRDSLDLSIRSYLASYGDELTSSNALQEAFVRKFDDIAAVNDA